jgi:hypothetical protein
MIKNFEFEPFEEYFSLFSYQHIFLTSSCGHNFSLWCGCYLNIIIIFTCILLIINNQNGYFKLLLICDIL